jgi:hypothetical protein
MWRVDPSQIHDAISALDLCSAIRAGWPHIARWPVGFRSLKTCLPHTALQCSSASSSGLVAGTMLAIYAAAHRIARR